MGVVYLIVLAIHLFAISQFDDSLAVASKPLLMIALFMFFFDRARKTIPKIKYFVFAAIAFSLLGDVLLIYQYKDPLYFITGLSAFLLAHVFYILYFRGIKKVNGAQPSPVKTILAVIAGIYCIVLLAILFPYLGSMVAPVIVYALIITLMLISVFFAFANWNTTYAVFCTLGAVLFVASDSLLAYNKFRQPFASAGFLVMLTYGLAQFFLVWGAIKNLNRVPVLMEKTAA